MFSIPPTRLPKLSNVSAAVLTRDSSEFLPVLLETLARVFSEVVVGVDTNSSDDTYRVADRYATKLLRIDNPGGIVETAIEQLASQCSNPWVLRMDDDELLSPRLIEFAHEYITSLNVTAVGIHRKWCRVNLATSNLEYALSPSYGFDWQWRLFRKDKVKFDKTVHSPGIKFATSTKGPLDAFILHLVWVYRDLEQRWAKVLYYEGIKRGSGHPDYYLYEQLPPNKIEFLPLYLPDLDDVAQRLVPFQQRTDLRSTTFSTPDPIHLDVSLESATNVLSLRPLERVRIPIILTKHSGRALCSNAPHSVLVSYHWYHANSGQCVVHDGLRTVLPQTVYPNETISLSVDVVAPVESSKYDLALTLVREGHYWFEQMNPAVALRISSEVTAPDTRERASFVTESTKYR